MQQRPAQACCQSLPWNCRHVEEVGSVVDEASDGSRIIQEIIADVLLYEIQKLQTVNSGYVGESQALINVSLPDKQPRILSDLQEDLEAAMEKLDLH